MLPAPDVPFTDAVKPAACIRFSRMHATCTSGPLSISRPSFNELACSRYPKQIAPHCLDIRPASLHLTRKAVKLVTQLGLDSQKVQVLINRWISGMS